MQDTSGPERCEGNPSRDPQDTLPSCLRILCALPMNFYSCSAGQGFRRCSQACMFLRSKARVPSATRFWILRQNMLNRPNLELVRMVKFAGDDLSSHQQILRVTGAV